MSKRDYEMIAGVLSDHHRDETSEGYAAAVAAIANQFADELAKANPRFNRTRFLAACGA